MSKLTEPVAEVPEEAPPLGSWPKMYAVVLGVLVVDIVLLTVFTRVFS